MGKKICNNPKEAKNTPLNKSLNKQQRKKSSVFYKIKLVSSKVFLCSKTFTLILNFNNKRSK